MGKYFSDNYPVKSNLDQGALMQLLFSFAVEYGVLWTASIWLRKGTIEGLL
jgi:hypothetical protein